MDGERDLAAPIVRGEDADRAAEDQEQGVADIAFLDQEKMRSILASDAPAGEFLL